jgi:hypothetical protein
VSQHKIHTSPRGKLKYPWLREPDKRFDAEGKYKVDLVLHEDDDGVKEFIERIDKAVAASKGKNSPYKYVDGSYMVKFSSAYQPAVFDGRNVPIPAAVKIGSGSVGKVAFIPNVYKGFGGGVNLYLKAVQVSEIVEFGADPDSYGFTAEDAPEEEKADGSADEAEEENLPF